MVPIRVPERQALLDQVRSSVPPALLIVQIPHVGRDPTAGHHLRPSPARRPQSPRLGRVPSQPPSGRQGPRAQRDGARIPRQQARAQTHPDGDRRELSCAHPRLIRRAEPSAEFQTHVDDWVEHVRFWSQASLPRHLVRYEDLRRQPIAELTRIVRFLLPDVDLDTDPIVNRKSIACATRPDPALEPYRPRRIANFASWDDYTPAARRVLLDKSALWWCKCVSSAWATTLTLADSATRSWRRPRACSRGSTAMRSRGQTRRRWTRRAARRHCTLYHYAHAQSSLEDRQRRDDMHTKSGRRADTPGQTVHQLHAESARTCHRPPHPSSPIDGAVVLPPAPGVDGSSVAVDEPGDEAPPLPSGGVSGMTASPCAGRHHRSAATKRR